MPEKGVQCELRIGFGLTAPGNLVQVDLIWQGKPVKIETLRQWNELPLAGSQGGYPLTLKEVLAHHHAEIWPHTEDPVGTETSLRLFIPMVHSEGRFGRYPKSHAAAKRPGNFTTSTCSIRPAKPLKLKTGCWVN
jgi:hypothetical protein